ncbi:hypothetical protein CHARACLAT_028041 [Characodon lateralis]|uniref:Uncharacterized protein n=1 Tax=Characodon lateralis TaxID=208331 RepID=A0ABU7CRV8_9TELE|nr:hypothetical protein [Characodon lateralis]
MNGMKVSGHHTVQEGDWFCASWMENVGMSSRKKANNLMNMVTEAGKCVSLQSAERPLRKQEAIILKSNIRSQIRLCKSTQWQRFWRHVLWYESLKYKSDIGSIMVCGCFAAGGTGALNKYMAIRGDVEILKKHLKTSTRKLKLASECVFLKEAQCQL